MKKIKIIALIYTICLIVGTVSVSASNSYLIESINKGSKKFNLANEQGYITNEIVNINDNEINLKLSINNKKQNQQIKEPGTEIMIVIDNSASMSEETSDGSIRKTVLLDSVTSLVDKIYENSKDTKVGIVRFAGIWDEDDYDCDDTDSYCKDGITGTQEVLQTGSVLMKGLTSNKNDVVNAVNSIRNLDTILKENTELATNIALGLKTAKDNFTSTNNTKVILLLTDGVPTQYFDKSIGGWMSFYQQDDANRDTKSYLSSLGNDYNIISLMTGVTDEDDLEHIESIFGTSENPTTGKFYNIQDSDIEQIVENNIFDDLSEYISNPINNINIKLNLNQEIIENFDLTYNQTTGFNYTNENYSISEISGNDTAVLDYKITLKNNFSGSIYDKIIPIFNSLNVSYSDSENNNHTLQITDSPTIRIVKLPKTGINNSNILFGTLLVISIGSIFYLNKVNKLKNI